MNFHNSKKKKIISAIIVVLLVFGMVAGLLIPAMNF